MTFLPGSNPESLFVINEVSCFGHSLGLSLFIFKRFYLFIFRGERREEERERKINVWLPLPRPVLGTWPAIQACALTGNRTGDSLVCRLCSVH